MKHTSRVFSIKEQYKTIIKASKAFIVLRKSRPRKLMNKQLKERIMLAITQVNGCTMCSFVHTKIALSSGMELDQIKQLLDGDLANAPKEETVALLYAQEFAYTKESPSKESRARLIEEYGRDKANAIHAACYMITMTNGMGTSMDYFWSRLRFKRNKESNLGLEIINPLLTMFLFPTSLLYNMVKCKLTERKLYLIKE
jgi:AhpD family alkylhydroperoxidase